MRSMMNPHLRWDRRQARPAGTAGLFLTIPVPGPGERDGPAAATEAAAGAVKSWFLGGGDRANPATDPRTFTIGNLVRPVRCSAAPRDRIRGRL